MLLQSCGVFCITSVAAVTNSLIIQITTDQFSVIKKCFRSSFLINVSFSNIQLLGVILPLLKQLSLQEDVRPLLYESFHMPEWFNKHGIPPQPNQILQIRSFFIAIFILHLVHLQKAKGKGQCLILCIIWFVSRSRCTLFSFSILNLFCSVIEANILAQRSYFIRCTRNQIYKKHVNLIVDSLYLVVQL